MDLRKGCECSKFMPRKKSQREETAQRGKKKKISMNSVLLHATPE